MSLPLFSVIIPAYNRAHVLERAIESVLKQTFQDLELLIVDDGSSDNTQALLEKYRSYGQIRIFKTSNQGVSQARNFAAREARGRWLAFLDSDDEWLESKLERQHPLTEQGAQLIHSEEIWIRNGKRVNPPKLYLKGGGDQFAASVKTCAISPSTALVEKKHFWRLGGFREDFPVCEDYDLWLKHTSLYEVGFVPDALIKKYGGHADQLSGRFRAMDFWRVKSLKWLLEHRDLGPERRELVVETLKEKVAILANGYRKRNKLSELGELQALAPEFF